MRHSLALSSLILLLERIDAVPCFPTNSGFILAAISGYLVVSCHNAELLRKEKTPARVIAVASRAPVASQKIYLMFVALGYA